MDLSSWIPFLTELATLALIYGLLTMGLNLHFGYAGLINFGHVAFFAAGAFTSALLTLPPPGSEAYLEIGGRYSVGFGLPVPVGLIAASAVSGLLALLISLTSIRLKGHYLAVATFALAEIFRSFLSNEEWLTRGEYGITGVPQPLKGTLIPVAAYPYTFLAAAAAIVALVFWTVWRTTESPFGRVLRGIREDETAARSLGKDTPRLKLNAFVLGGALAGLAGGLWTHWIGAVHVGQFVPIVTFQVWLAMLLGGAGSHGGALVGAFFLMVIREGTRFLSNIPGLETFTATHPTFLPALRFVIIGLLLILVIRYFPAGVWPERRRRAPPAAEEGGP